jgi:YfiH family protein
MKRLNIFLMNGKEFLLRESQGIHYYSCCAFERVPHLHHGFSTRCGGAPDLNESSLNLSNSLWDSPARVSENRRRFLTTLHLEDAHLITLRQVHSNRVHIIKNISSQWNQSEGDALATRVENVALSVQVADCLPVLIADPVANAVAAVHSGWRGTLSQILLQTIREMEKAFNCDPSTLLVAVGPGIRACCFEVGSEVADLFDGQYPGCCSPSSAIDNSRKYLLDLGKALDVQMNLAGIQPEHRYDLGACTRCNPNEFFSYRAEGQAAGRMMAVIGLSPRSV